MNNIINLWPGKEIKENDKVKYSFTLEFPSGEREEIWYKVPIERQAEVTDLADPYLIASIFFAMALKTNLHVHGTVSSSLLENLEEYQAVWKSWEPNKYSKVEIICDNETNQMTKLSEEAIASFSGGVDSCFSVYSNYKHLNGRKNKNITAGLMVHGFDIPLQQIDKFTNAAKASQEILKDVDIPLITISTNWRIVARDFKINWEDSHATAVVAPMCLLQKRYATGVIANTYTYSFLHWGSNPLTDPLLSSTSFSIVHDGADFTRVEKISIISDWQIANKNLRVCWEGDLYDRNCCSCEKCIRTILNYRVVGKNRPESFPKDVKDSQILGLVINNDHTLEFEQILDKANDNKMSNESWVKALDKRIRKYKIEMYLKSLKSTVKNLIRN